VASWELILTETASECLPTSFCNVPQLPLRWFAIGRNRKGTAHQTCNPGHAETPGGKARATLSNPHCESTSGYNFGCSASILCNGRKERKNLLQNSSDTCISY
jgi:hypothetical protein